MPQSAGTAETSPSSPPSLPAASSASRGRLDGLVPRSALMRQLGFVTLVNTFGNGLFMTVSVLYFTRFVGLSYVSVGLGMTLAGAFGVAAGLLFGRAADRFAPRPMLVALLLLSAVGMAVYTQVASFAGFLVTACAIEFVDRGGSAVRSAIIATAVTGAERTRARAFLRTLTNIGIGLGILVAAAALQLNTRTAYQAMLIGDGLTFLAAAAMMASVRFPASGAVAPAGAPTAADATTEPAGATDRGARASGPAVAVRSSSAPAERPASAQRPSPLRDRRYLAFLAVNMVMTLQFGLIEVGVPLWIVRDTNAPRFMVAVAMVVNTGLVVLLQMRAGRGMDDPAHAARAFRTAGLLVAAFCLVLALAGLHSLPAAGASVIIVVAMVLQTLGEVRAAGAGWGLGFELADPAAPGAYQGAFNSANSAAGMIAPSFAANTGVRFGLPGWGAAAAVFVLAGAAMVPLVRKVAAPAAGRTA
jgi:MFS family permease